MVRIAPDGETAEAIYTPANVSPFKSEVEGGVTQSPIVTGDQGLSQNMAPGNLPPPSTAAGGAPPWEAADFRVLVTGFLGPCASTEIIISILAYLAIGTIPLFNQISREYSASELEVCDREQLRTVTQDFEIDVVINSFEVMRNMFGSRLIRERVGGRVKPCIPTRIFPEPPG